MHSLPNEDVETHQAEIIDGRFQWLMLPKRAFRPGKSSRLNLTLKNGAYKQNPSEAALKALLMHP
jgi:hypothetical protein